MINYNFDYLVEKVQVLNEMAKFSTFWRTNFPEFENFYLQVQKKMGQHPKAPSSGLGDKRIEYIARMLFDFLSKEELAAIGINKNKGFEANVYNLAIREIPQEERIERGTRKKREYTPGYAEFAGTWADNTPKQQDYMLSLMVRAYEEKALSEKFVNKVMDKSNIDAYFDKNLFKDFSSNFAAGMKARKEGLINTGNEESDKMDLGSFYEIQNRAKAIIQKLRKSKKLPRGLRTSIYNADIGNIKEKSAKFDKELYPLIVMQTTLEQFLELKKEIIQDIRNGEQITPKEERLFKFDRATLSNLLDIVNNRINEKKPLSLEKIYSNIIEKMDGISDQVRREYDGFYEDLQSDSSMDAMKDRYDTVFDMLDDELLNSLEREGIINSEDRETLKKWASISGNLQKNIQTRGEKIILKNIERGEKAKNAEAAQKKYEDRGKKWEADKKLKEKGVKKPKINIEGEVAGLSAPEIEEKLREMMDDDDPDYKKIDAVSKYLKKLKKSNPEDEECVMNYMTEQVHKDGFIDNRGKFVDRGFKKPKNYAHWLWLNEQ